MNTYKVQVFARIVGFHEATIEAATEYDARRIALEEAKKLGPHGFDLEEIESTEINEIEEISP